MKVKGFTLIELLIVMAIISILVGIALPRFRGMQDEANIAKAQGELRALKTAIESYYMHVSAYPATTATICATSLNDASPIIIEDVLTDPFRTGGAEYNYILNGRYYVVFSYGVDGAADITGITNVGVLQGTNDDDIFATNGTSWP